MQAPNRPDNEVARLQRLHQLGLLDRASPIELAAITRLMARHFELPIVVISLVDDNRQWFLANHGLRQQQTPRDISFCGHAILRPHIMEIRDARVDPRFTDNPLVKGEPQVVFYAGRPLRSLEGLALGALCLVGHQPRQLTDMERADLDDFALLVESYLHDQERRTQLEQLDQHLHYQETLFEQTFNQAAVGMALSTPQGEWLRANQSLCTLLGYAEVQLLRLTWQAMTHPEDLSQEQPLFNQLLAGDLSRYQLEKRMLRADGTKVWVQLSVALCPRRGDQPAHIIAIFADMSAHKATEAALLALQLELETRVTQRTQELSRTMEALAREQHRLHNMQESSSEALIELDTELKIISWNRAATSLLGWPAEQVIGTELAQYIGSETVAAMVRGASVPPVRQEYDIQDRDGHLKSIELMLEQYDFAGQQSQLVLMHDISARRREVQQILQSEARLKAIADGVPALVSLVSTTGHYLFANQTYQQMFGIQPIGMQVRDLMGDANYALIEPLRQRAIAGERLSFECTLDTLQGPRNMHVTFIPATGPDEGVYILGTDVTEFKALQRQLEHEVSHDPLTSLPNRRAFHLRLNRELTRCAQGGPALGLLFLDLDGFKQLNDRLGHDFGDTVLRYFARLLVQQVRPGDMVARLAGDEFTVILPALHQPRTDLTQLCDRLVQALAEVQEIDGHQVVLASSIGAALCGAGQRQSADALLNLADRAMYQAKAAGKGCYMIVPAPTAE